MSTDFCVTIHMTHECKSAKCKNLHKDMSYQRPVHQGHFLSFLVAFSNRIVYFNVIFSLIHIHEHIELRENA